MRTCAQAGCITALSQYNLAERCFVHTARVPTGSAGIAPRKTERPPSMQRGLVSLAIRTWGTDALSTRRPWWQAKAACAGKGRAVGDFWFGEDSSSKRSTLTLVERRGKHTCFGCLVQVECLTYALEIERDLGSQAGIWGGATQGERRYGRMLEIDEQAELILSRLADQRRLGLGNMKAAS